jgi:hypothetical protein
VPAGYLCRLCLLKVPSESRSLPLPPRSLIFKRVNDLEEDLSPEDFSPKRREIDE